MQQPLAAAHSGLPALCLLLAAAVLASSLCATAAADGASPAAAAAAAVPSAALQPNTQPPPAVGAPPTAVVQHGVIPGQASELYRWYAAALRSEQQQQQLAGTTAAFHCLAKTFLSGPQDRKVFSQVGEDGIIEAIFNCIGTTDKFYVEFGTQTGAECTTRYLREHKGWTGLLMDGGFENATINLHKEYVYAENIVQLFGKYAVPKPSFDYMSVDVDLNTAYLMRAVLAGGYRPRLLAVEYNRNFAPTDSYITMYAPDETWAGNCYFGGSGLALERIAQAFDYSLVAFDQVGVNLFFVRNDILGRRFPHSFAQLTKNASAPAWTPLHQSCIQTPWMYVEASRKLADMTWMHHLYPVQLSHKDEQLQGQQGGLTRSFYEFKTPFVMAAYPCGSSSRVPGPGGGGGTSSHATASWERGSGGGSGGQPGTLSSSYHHYPSAARQHQMMAWDLHRQRRHECRLLWLQQLHMADALPSDANNSD